VGVEQSGSAYDRGMSIVPRGRRRFALLWRALIEVGFIIFLFYANLLMGEFTASGGKGKSLAFAVQDMFTGKNFVIALISALIGYVVFERLRQQV
jgi:hypothetical protein